MKLSAMTALNGRQWVWFVEAWMRLCYVRLRLKMSGPKWLKGSIVLAPKVLSGAPLAGNSTHGNETCGEVHPKNISEAERMYESVRLAARSHFGQPACLPKSIVLRDMLRTRHGSANVILGVVKQHKQLASHAWVELDDVLIGEPESVKTDFSRLGL